ncbi:type II secretory pathway, component HofQ [Pleurocapsa sp. PCC 7327]|uniref:secretin N-terminal domain-containing protein n=1 Tax=Pleurocapsa sp. PCC 7327 TaxID=118163 RepID=UPI00029F87B5|nr:secretin N-terminal domain-containing protein [Pleurocapsa sp. PCC 7327]AFY79381.1 type II secretory pathway, component HofQ [Pleurocapsa sp. PCC 7327]
MKSYYYPLMIGGAAIMLLAARSAQAATEKENNSSKNATGLKQEILVEAANYFEKLEQFSQDKSVQKNKAIDKKTGTKKEPAFSKQIDKISLTSFSKSSDFDSLLTSKSPQWLAQTPTLPAPNPSSAPMVPQPQVTIQESGSSNPGNTNQAQGMPSTSSPAPMVPQPQITIQDNGNTNTGVNVNIDPNANAPTDILQPTTPVVPVLPRAVAPPVGDIAISNIDPSADLIDLGTDVLVPRLVLRQAPAREVLAVLARYAGLNLVFTDGIQSGGQGQEQAQTAAEPTVSLDLENESVQEVFNSVLLVSGLNANRRGRTIFVGSNLPHEARNLISRTLRLNQASVVNAGTVLASQGASFQRVVTPVEEVVDPVTQRVVRRVERPAEIQPIKVGEEAGVGSPLLLAGLTVTADDRLNALTLTGDPRQVEVATSMLTQLDARRRQVAVNVKVVDVNLSNTENFGSSFSFGIDDTFFIQDQGAATLRFGTSSPATSADINSATGRIANPPVIPNPAADANTFLDLQNTTPIPGTVPGTIIFNQRPGAPQPFQRIPPGTGDFFNRRAGVSGNPFEAGFTDFTLATDNTLTIAPDGTVSFTPGELGTATAGLASLFQYPKRFLAQLNAQITSGNAKILTDPTLVVQEGQEATVRLTEKVLESVNTQVDPLSGVRTTTPVLADAGLTLTVNIERIDDNGFVNLSVSPTVAAPGNSVEFDSGNGTVNTLTLLNRRELSSGLIRLRDGQTLIVSGIIQDSDRTIVSKVPILGDIPILGALFRSTDNIKERAEVIIMLTPQIIDDNPRSQFGYNYNPSPAASEILQDQGFDVQTNPNRDRQEEKQKEGEEQPNRRQNRRQDR